MVALTQLIGTGSGTGFVVELAAKGTVALSATWAVTVVMRRASAATRHGVWVVGLAIAAGLPLGALMLPDLSVPAFVGAAPAVPVPARVADPSQPGRSTPAAARPPVADARDTPRPVPAPRPRVPPVTAWAFVVWWIGALVAVARVLAARARTGLVTRFGGLAVSDAVSHVAGEVAHALRLGRPFRLVRSSWLSVPATWGWWRPVVILPRDAEGWDEERLRVVLLHELAHVKRRDYLTHLVSEIACAVHWPNPLVWLAARRAHAEQERACDDTVIRVGVQSAAYATHLVEIARAIVAGRQWRGALAMARLSTLAHRVRAILGDADRAPTARRAVGMTALAAGMVAVPLASLNVWGARDRELRARAFVEQLGNADPGARSDAAWGLAALRSGTARAGLVAALSDPDASVRGVAALALGERPEGAAPAELLAALDDPDSYVRENAVLGLYRYERDARARAGVLRMTTDPAPGVRSVTVWVLGEMGGPDASAALSRVILHDSDEHTRGMASGSMMRFDAADAVATFTEALEHGDAALRREALWALGRLGDPGALPRVLAVLADDPDPDVRTHAARALADLARPEAVAGLVAALRDSSRYVREWSVHALAAIGTRPAVEGILQALRDDAHQVRITAVWALNELNRP